MGFFSRKNKETKNAEMGWRYVKYWENREAIFFVIEPMVKIKDIVYVPDEINWLESAPNWAKSKRQDILDFLSAFGWNRDLEWRNVNDKVLCKQIGEKDVVSGSIESTNAGGQLESARLFNPEKRSELTKEQVHGIWETAEMSFAKQQRGRVNLFVGPSIVEDSVFQKISLPTLKNNPNVELIFH